VNKYHFNIRINIKFNNAGNKATLDCRRILRNSGFEDLEISFVKSLLRLPFNVIKLLANLGRIYLRMKPGSFVLVQYPLQGFNPFFKRYAGLLKKKGCTVCAIVHDLDSIRAPYDPKKTAKEMDALSAYDGLISHNASMTNRIRKGGYKGFITEIELFDYLSDGHQPREKALNGQPRIAFAGNLGRGSFLQQLFREKPPFKLNLYGSGLNETAIADNNDISWIGSFSPEKIVEKIDADYGLIWDGDKTDDIAGLSGKYLEINTPHKTSLYLASGIPVIAPATAAITPFLKANKIGISIKSISEIPEKVTGIGSEEYSEMRKNARAIGKKLKEGHFFTQAVLRLEKHFFTEEKK
jgi:glycosyltransferase involved in cell wall biosynthesis